MSKSNWQESARGSESVDEAAGVIRGVKVLGLKSTNGRRYSEAAVKKAVAAGLYNCAVNINHRREPGERPMDDLFGELREARIDSDGGIRADLHYLTEHPMAKRVAESARKFPNRFGLSHSAGGDEIREGGENVVVDITEVFSVDVVTKPATNKSLFESESKQTTLRELCEQHEQDAQAASFVKLLREDMGAAAGYDPMGQQVSIDPQAQPMAQLDAAFTEMCLAVVHDKTLDSAGKLARMKAIFKAQDSAAAALSKGDKPGGGNEEDDDMSTNGGDNKGAPAKGDEGKDKKNEAAPTIDAKLVESMQTQIDTLTKEVTEAKAREAKALATMACTKLLESNGRKATEVRIEAMLLLEEAKREAFVKEFPADGEANPGNGGFAPTGKRPDASPGRFNESQADTKYPEKTEDFLAALN